MGLEIEKKFLIHEKGQDYSTPAFRSMFQGAFPGFDGSVRDIRDCVLRNGVKIRQGYLPVEIGREISDIMELDVDFEISESRLRDAGGRYFLTHKSEGGLARNESPETEIRKTVFDLYWGYALNRIEKSRIALPYGDNEAEIDVYIDRDLIVAEVEVPDKAEAERVASLGKDVTEERAYKNKNLPHKEFNRRFIFTGAPCSGKSTTLEYLARMQYRHVPEHARPIIKEQERIGGNILPWQRFMEFQLEVLHKALEAERELDEWGTVFFDRGIHDGVVYCAEAGLSPPTPLVDAVKDSKYLGVFIFDLLPYKNDDERKETPEEAAKIHIRLLETYRELGFEPIIVPDYPGLEFKESVKKRAHFVIEKTFGF